MLSFDFQTGFGLQAVRWFVITGLWVAVVVGAESATSKGDGVSPEPARLFPIVEGARLCQTYRLKNGVATKIGKPHPCRDKRAVQLSDNLRGGATLPQ